MKVVIDNKLFDAGGNYCRVEMHSISPLTYEVYFHDFNDFVPRRFVGPESHCRTRIEQWTLARAADGFIFPTAPENPTISVSRAKYEALCEIAEAAKWINDTAWLKWTQGQWDDLKAALNKLNIIGQ